MHSFSKSFDEAVPQISEEEGPREMYSCGQGREESWDPFYSEACNTLISVTTLLLLNLSKEKLTGTTRHSEIGDLVWLIVG